MSHRVSDPRQVFPSCVAPPFLTRVLTKEPVVLGKDVHLDLMMRSCRVCEAHVSANLKSRQTRWTFIACTSWLGSVGAFGIGSQADVASGSHIERVQSVGRRMRL